MKNIFRFFQNMRWKLFLTYIFLIIFNISIVSILFYFITMGRFVSDRESYLVTTADYFIKFVSTNMQTDQDLAGASKFYLRQYWDQMDYTLVVIDLSRSVVSDSRNLDEQRMGVFSIGGEVDKRVMDVLSTEKSASWKKNGEDGIVLQYCTPIYFENKIVGVVQVGMSTDDFDAFFEILREYFVVTFMLSLLAALIVALIFIKHLMKPVRKISNAASEISLGNFDIRVDYSAGDELGDLSRTINKMAGDLKKLDQTRNSFLANISHELKTPLTIIKGFAMTMAGDKNLDDDQKHFLEVINRESDRLTRLVNELLELSRIRTGRIALNFINCNIGELIESVSFSLQNKAEKCGCSIETSIQEGLPNIPIDLDKIKEVMINLIDNAIKYSQGHGDCPKVFISAAMSDGFAVIKVEDTGPGISEEDLEMVFERFFRGGSRMQKVEGVGLGLAIVKEIVAAHNGKITVDSPDGKGCVFEVFLPIARRDS